VAIKNGVCNSYKRECMLGVHTAADVYKIALYTDKAELSAATTAYTPTGEVHGPGYEAGGLVLTGFTVSGTQTARLDFSPPVWQNTTIYARGCLIYNSSKNNRAVVVCDFGQSVISTNGPFSIPMPDVGDTTSLVRFA